MWRRRLPLSPRGPPTPALRSGRRRAGGRAAASLCLEGGVHTSHNGVNQRASLRGKNKASASDRGRRGASDRRRRSTKHYERRSRRRQSRPANALATRPIKLSAPIQSSEAAPANFGRAHARRRLKSERASMGRWSVGVLIEPCTHTRNVDDPFYVRPSMYFYSFYADFNSGVPSFSNAVDFRSGRRPSFYDHTQGKLLRRTPSSIQRHSRRIRPPPSPSDAAAPVVIARQRDPDVGTQDLSVAFHP